MGKRLGRVLVFGATLAVIVAGSACNKSRNNDAVGQGLDNGGGPPPGMGMAGGPWAGMGGGGPGRPRGPIGEIMMKLGKGPQSLTNAIGGELKGDAPPWETIQTQAKEYAQLAVSMGKYDPPKGSKESWMKLTASFSDSAAALDRAAQTKNKDDALAAHTALSQSCMACHRAHRGGPGGMGPPGRFGPPGQN